MPTTVVWGVLATLAFVAGAAILFLLRTLRKERQTLARLTSLLDKARNDQAGSSSQDPEEALNRFLVRASSQENNLDGEQARIKILQYKKGRLEMVLDEHPDGLLLLDESSSLEFANTKARDFLALDQEHYLGLKFHEWCTDQDLSLFLSRYFRGGADRLCRAEQMEIRPESLPDKTLAVGAFPLFPRKEAPALSGTLVVIKDVTIEHLAEQARGEFVAHVSHELKAPLNVLSMYSEMLMGDEGKAEEFRIEAANTIFDEVDRLSTLVENLLSISKIEMGSISPERQRVKPVEFLEDLFSTIKRSGKGAGLTFELRLPKELPPLSIDKDLMRVAINNLLTNAIKYNSPQGAVSLSAGESEDRIDIEVKDNGLGIAQEDQDRIFNKFFRSRQREIQDIPGHGLGLALARSIIELHNGRLLLESTPGQGSTFTIRLEKSGGLVQQGI